LINLPGVFGHYSSPAFLFNLPGIPPHTGTGCTSLNSWGAFHPVTFFCNSALSLSSSCRWLSRICCISGLGFAGTGTGSVTGLCRRRRRFLILAIGSGVGSGCFFVRRFRLGMPGMIAGIKGT
jgi:hypothetical protein